MAGETPDTGLPGMVVEAGMRALLVDRVTVEVQRALADRGIPSVVLKGPAIAQWLYTDGEVRGYGDSDLLVPHADWTRAGEVLTELGFQNFLSVMAHPRMESIASDPWFRGEQDVDLHSTIYGLAADPAEVWEILSANTAMLPLAGAEVPVLGEPARALHLALHAAQHQDGKAVHDLRKGVAQLPESLWWEAAELAGRARGLPAFVGGLRLVEGGHDLLQRMGLSRVRSTHTELRAGQVPLAESLNELLETPGARAKLRFFRAEVFPGPVFLRWWSPLARRGRLGLALAYAWRPLYIAMHAPAAVRAV
jgi:hypothetical protein